MNILEICFWLGKGAVLLLSAGVSSGFAPPPAHHPVLWVGFRGWKQGLGVFYYLFLNVFTQFFFISNHMPVMEVFLAYDCRF